MQLAYVQHQIQRDAVFIGSTFATDLEAYTDVWYTTLGLYQEY